MVESRPLRIAVFVHEFPALSETFVLNQLTGLIDLGHDVRIFALRPRVESRVHPDVKRYGLVEKTTYLSMARSRLRRMLGGLGIVLRHGHRRPRQLMRLIDADEYGRDAASLRMLHWGVQLWDEAPFDVIQCHFGPVGQFAAKLRDCGVLSGRLVTVFHGIDISAYLRDRRDYYQYLLSTGDLFLPISSRWRRTLLDLGSKPEKTIVHRMGVDPRAYVFSVRCPVKGRPLRVVTVGRMIEKKGIRYALEAVAGAVRKGANIRYDVIGDGPLRSVLERQAESLGIAERVTFHGMQDQAAVAAFMNAADVLLAPSITASDGDQEGIPVTIMEAMATGLVVISTWHSAIPELIENGRSGWLVAERDSEALRDRLLNLVNLPESWTGISMAARRRIENEYDISGLNRRLVGLFEMILGDDISTSASAAHARPSAQG